MSSTLVIHPKDVTTDCLSVIYENQDWDLIRSPATLDQDVRDQIASHSRIIMLGHGSPDGLLCPGFRGQIYCRFGRYIIDHSHAELLKDKDTFSIWCNSDEYFRTHDMRGLHTGMIISEVTEEYAVLGKAPLNYTQMTRNMKLFSETFAKYITLEPEELRRKVLEEYDGKDEVTRYNRSNILVL